jgi:hypothetical protein
VMFRRTKALAWMVMAILSTAAVAHAAPGFGKIAGVVVDPSGTPQMGATIWVTPENPLVAAPAEILTNQRGAFSVSQLPPGQYSLKVTLAGFLPGIERHIRVTSNLTTLVRIELDSVFASLDRLRRHTEVSADPDEWKWVLRTSTATRPVLQWQDGEVRVVDANSAMGDSPRRSQPHARIELTSGSLRRGSVSHLPDSPGTAFAYDQSVGRTGRLLFAGQMSYERAAAGGFATLWVPSGELGVGPSTSLVLRQTKLGPDGKTFRGLRLAHSDQLALGDHLRLKYGAEYIMVGLGRAASSLRPEVELDTRLSPNWEAYGKVASMPLGPEGLQSEMLQTALATLDAFPALLWRHGRPVLEGGWHNEVGIRRHLGLHSYLEVSGFHDGMSHVAVYGRGAASQRDFFHDFFSDALLYDGGASNSWGTRVAYRQKICDDLEFTAVYAWAGALALGDSAADSSLRDALQTRYRHSLAARVSGTVPTLGTRVTSSYKWLSGGVVSRQDAFGESALQLDPYLNLSVRQPIPTFFRGGKWEALADFRNLLGEGYVSVSGPNGQIMLVPAVRSFRGGVSFQF